MGSLMMIAQVDGDEAALHFCIVGRGGASGVSNFVLWGIFSVELLFLVRSPPLE